MIEIGIVRFQGGRAVAHYSQLIDPQRRISAGITAITGITNEMIAGQPTFARQFELMMSLLSGGVLLGITCVSICRFCERNLFAVGGTFNRIWPEPTCWTR